MRKIRDYDKELDALAEKIGQLKMEKIQRLGELVMATGADRIEVETLAGALLHIVKDSTSDANEEVWRALGVAFFQDGGRKASNTPRNDQQVTEAGVASNAQS